MNRSGPGQLYFRLEEGELGGVDVASFHSGTKSKKGG